MQNKKGLKIISYAITFLAISSIIAAIIIKNNMDKKVAETNQEERITEKDISYSKEITIKEFISSFNTELQNRKLKYLLNNEYMKEDNNTYYYGIFDDIGFYVIPVNYTGNQEKDIVKTTSIFYPSQSKNKELAYNYVNTLLKVNLNNISEDDIKTLLFKAQEDSKNNKALDENNGIFISYNEKENNIFYIITRNYQKNGE